MNKIKSNWVFGLLIIICGIIILSNNLGFSEIDLGYLFRNFWPVFIIVFGINFILNRGSIGEVISGIIFIFIGSVLIGNNLDIIDFDLSLLWKSFWPIILILIGVNILFQNNSNGKSNFALMGSIEKNTEPWILESRSYVAVMGGIDLDLTLAEIPQGETTVDITTIMGGIDVIVPEDISVKCSGTSILGGLDLLDKSTGGILANTDTVREGDPNKTIVFNCVAVLGGIEIKTKKPKVESKKEQE